jgi:hypothetical protein
MLPDRPVAMGPPPVVVGLVGEFQRADSEVGEVLPVDTGVGPGGDQAQSEIAGRDGRVLA